VNRSTADQYELIDGNLACYLNRLLYKRNNIQGKSRRQITRGHLMSLWQKQDGRCAISGIIMTCRAQKGTQFPHNASIDCIVPISQGGRYEPGNIQLVWTVVNGFVRDYSKTDILNVCFAVAKFNAQPKA